MQATASYRLVVGVPMRHLFVVWCFAAPSAPIIWQLLQDRVLVGDAGTERQMQSGL